MAMTAQVRQFLKLFLAVVILVHLLVGAFFLSSWIIGRHHGSGSVQPAAQNRQ